MGRGRKFIRRLFTAKLLIAGESILGLMIAFVALFIAGMSMLQSRQANRTAAAANTLAEDNNRINKKALAISEQAAAAKSEITLHAAVSDDSSPTLTLKPTSAEFVLSDSQIEYMRLFAETVANKDKPPSNDKDSKWMIPVPVTDDAEEAGVHGLTILQYALEEEISSSVKKHKWRVKMLSNINTYDIAGYFPVLIRVDYAYEGHQARAVLLYEMFYSGWLESGEGGIRLGKPRLVRRLDHNEDPTAVLRERFRQWQKENFTLHREPEVATPTPTQSQRKKSGPKK
jgi:hypothetical protein